MRVCRQRLKQRHFFTPVRNRNLYFIVKDDSAMRFLSRRNLLISSAAAGAIKAASSELSPGKLRVIVTGGHPGDPEYGCGGTIARYSELGHEVTLLYLNRGEKGCPGKGAK